jgi:hypothetical protein
VKVGEPFFPACASTFAQLFAVALRAEAWLVRDVSVDHDTLHSGESATDPYPAPVQTSQGKGRPKAVEGYAWVSSTPCRSSSRSAP